MKTDANLLKQLLEEHPNLVTRAQAVDEKAVTQLIRDFIVDNRPEIERSCCLYGAVFDGTATYPCPECSNR